VIRYPTRPSLPLTAETDPDDTSEVDVDGIYRSQWHTMVRLAVLLVHDLPSAEDAVQDAFVALHRNHTRLDDPDAAIGYLRIAVINRCRSLIRRRAVARRHIAAIGMNAGAAAPEADTAIDEQMMAAIRTLPRRTQEVIVLRYWADLSETQIADALGVSTGTVKSTASRGLARLREMLGDAP
jgi:RNA polymerase sigma-70 factor (sigma-E family)